MGAEAGRDGREPGDLNEAADVIEEFETNSAILKDLEIRFNDVKDALDRLEEGTYGICEIDSKPIPEERLMANSAANTCIEHAPKE